ncbi:MAG TPA: glycine cleavage T C-terminal barrel domain-containing protein [Acidimicrobiales bacterium]|nr:glycine cleavage T C-terminal barrel domain-containing protein [Acidimicrobiales bacterium]
MDDARAYVLERDVIRIAGPDAISYLQGQLSQDVASLAVGASAFTFLLEPQGKVSAWGRITRIADDAILFDVDRGFADATIARMTRFKLRTKADIDHLEWRVVALKGDIESFDSVEAIVARFDWPGLEGVDLMGADVEVPGGIAVGDHPEYERRRIEAGLPAMGHELDLNTIPAEAGDVIIDKSVSFTKGCYTGQELVARVDSRGNNTPRRLRLVRVDDGVPEAGSELLVDDKVVGKLTSVAASDGGAVALAYVPRAVVPPVAALVVDQAGRRYTSICVPLAGPAPAVGTGERAAT